jgi:exoribonuclease R
VVERDGGLPPPEERSIEYLRRTARGLHIDWPAGMGYQELIRSLDAGRPAHAAMLRESTSLLRGAGYATFDGEPPEQHEHAALATPYAHTTAPLRRLVDRYALELSLAACAGTPPPEWALAALPTLPEEMQASGRRAGAAERAVVDLVEAAVLAPRVGQEFQAVIVDVDDKGRGGVVQLADPPVIGRLDGRDLPLGAQVPVRLATADVQARRVEFTLA